MNDRHNAKFNIFTRLEKYPPFFTKNNSTQMFSYLKNLPAIRLKSLFFFKPMHKENLADTFRIYHLQATYFPFTFLSLQETKNM